MNWIQKYFKRLKRVTKPDLSLIEGPDLDKMMRRHNEVIPIDKWPECKTFGVDLNRGHGRSYSRIMVSTKDVDVHEVWMVPQNNSIVDMLNHEPEAVQRVRDAEECPNGNDC